MNNRRHSGGTSRIVRINEQIMQEMCVILRECKDPRIDIMTSVVRTDTTKDLKYCKIYVSTLGDENRKKEVAEGLKSAKSFIRSELAKRLDLRVTPELTFIMDDSIEYSIHMDALLREIKGENNG